LGDRFRDTKRKNDHETGPVVIENHETRRGSKKTKGRALVRGKEYYIMIGQMDRV